MRTRQDVGSIKNYLSWKQASCSQQLNGFLSLFGTKTLMLIIYHYLLICYYIIFDCRLTLIIYHWLVLLNDSVEPSNIVFTNEEELSCCHG